MLIKWHILSSQYKRKIKLCHWFSHGGGQYIVTIYWRRGQNIVSKYRLTPALNSDFHKVIIVHFSSSLLMARSAAVAKRCASHTEWNISSVQCVGPLKIVAVADVVVRSEETASAARMKLMFGKQTVSGLTYGICAGHVSLGSRVTRLQCKGFPAFY